MKSFTPTQQDMQKIMRSTSFSTISPRTNHAGERIHHATPGVTKFTAIDGEGIDRGGNHSYALLGVGESQIEAEQGIFWREAFHFLYSHYEKGTAFVGFFLGYDFNQWLKTLPEERARMLLTMKGRAARQRKGKNPAPWPVQHDGWEFDLLGMKRFKLRPRSCEHIPVKGKPNCRCPKRPWMYICDTGPFFQQSFLSVINPAGWVNPVVTDEEYAIIEKGKADRAHKTRVDDDMRMYNRLENKVLVRVLNQMNTGFRDIGVHLSPSKWFGPGQAAQAWLVSEGNKPAKETIRDVPRWALDAARASYFGGWFEIMAHGTIPGDTYEYDINSAYPHIISTLPCLEHGKWSKGQGYPSVKNGELCLVRARVWAQSNLSPAGDVPNIGAMLHRNAQGGILRPTVTEGWYWWHELQAAVRAGCVKPLPARPASDLHPQIFEWVKYEPCDCYPPFRRVVNLYLRRLAVGKNSPLGKGAKTTYNSMYGKFAQSVGNPVFGNPVYASLVTAGCRTMILDAIATHPEGQKSVCMVATDAVYFINPHTSLKTGDGLGEWDCKVRTNLTLFKPGVYWDDDARRKVLQGSNPHFKARGISARDFACQLERIDREFARWQGVPPEISPGTGNQWPSVRYVTSFSMTTCLQALMQNDWTKAGYVSYGEDKAQDSNPSGKRCDIYYDAERSIYWSKPHTFKPLMTITGGTFTAKQNCESKPYEKMFGLEDPFSEQSRSQMGVTPDGNAYELLGYAWKSLVS